MAGEKILDLIDHYEQQILIYRDMYAVVEAQQQLCAEADFGVGDNLNKLNLLLSKRQKQMDLIEGNQAEVGVIKESLQRELCLEEINVETLTRVSPSPETAQLQAVVQRIESLLKDISTLDTKTQKLLKVKLNLVKQEMGKVQTAKKVTRAYNPAKRQKEGIFIDGSK
ncbi:MAG: hypothetical protein Q7J85_15055 [Bacillota bacterium]|nr:hypothetical protein [Bacillota bacterium]